MHTSNDDLGDLLFYILGVPYCVQKEWFMSARRYWGECYDTRGSAMFSCLTPWALSYTCAHMHLSVGLGIGYAVYAHSWLPVGSWLEVCLLPLLMGLDAYYQSHE